MLHGAEVARHASPQSCWIVLDAQVYDVTSFLSQHPGGAAILLRYGGADATGEFSRLHPPEYVRDLPAGSCLGALDPSTVSSLRQPSRDGSPPPPAEDPVPPLAACVRVDDFEAPARAVLSRRSWVYVSSSANAGLSLRANLADWSRVSFRPRVLRDVETVDTRAAILGHATPLPFYASPMGTLGAAHPAAEPELMRGLVRRGLHGVLSTASTKPAPQIRAAFDAERRAFAGGASPSRLFFQLYLPADRDRAVALIRMARETGFDGLWITVDLPVLGKRTADWRLQAEEALAAGGIAGGIEQAKEAVPTPAEGENPFSSAQGGRVRPGRLSARTTWADLAWIREAWGGGPIVLKGIQCAEDARLAAEHGCDGILLSNHGGRQLHTAPSALATLLEIRAYCPEVLGRLEVYVDGGLRDGADVLKALCLGATAVGVGRPFFYAVAAYGAAGVERCIDILSEELATAMRLVGITSLDQARPELVNASRLLNEMWRPERAGPGPQSRL